MNNNMGKSDRSIRSIIALVMIALYYYEIISGTLGIVLIVVSLIFLLTSLVGFCPLYAPFGISTCKPKGERL
jgi:small-conductance mechanosensitive channel